MKLEDRLKVIKNKGFTYNPENGNVISHKNKLILSNNNNYIRLKININNKTISVNAHKFAWYMYYNTVPICIDHINRIKDDNRIENLRNVTIQQNNFNKNTKGYWFNNKTNRYVATIKLNKIQYYIGVYKIEQDAKNAYLEAKKLYHVIV